MQYGVYLSINDEYSNPKLLAELAHEAQPQPVHWKTCPLNVLAA